MAMAKKTEEIILKEMEIVRTTIRIEGDSPLIMHKWEEKTKRQLLDSMMQKDKAGKGKAQREVRKPVEDFINSMYWMEGEPAEGEKNEAGFERAVANGARWGFPATSVKQAIVTAAYRQGYTKDMASLRGAFFIEGEGPEMLVEVKGCTPTMREDMVRVGMGKPDIRFRGQFTGWYMDLTIRYNLNGIYSLDRIVNLINLGGFACGIGEWRPEKDGQYGMFHVAQD